MEPLPPRPSSPSATFASAFRGAGGDSEVLHGISLHVNAGEKVALVGESGSGKSVTARLAMGLLQGGRGVRVSGSILFTGLEIAQGGPEIASLRGTRVTMIFQDPTSALNPTFTIRDQFRRVLRSHNRGLSRREADGIAEAGLADTQIENPRRVLDSYAFQLSGGMNQRVMIAMALVSRPALLIADEPGTALDVTVQAATLRLMHDLTEKTGTAVLLISHNLGVVREFSDRVYVIYRGSMVEHGTDRAALQRSAASLHPRAACRPCRASSAADCPASRSGAPSSRSRSSSTPVAASPARGGRRERDPRNRSSRPYLRRRRRTRSGPSTTFRSTVERGECHAIVGESGSGKTTLGNIILGIHGPTDGSLRFNGVALPDRRPKALKRAIQLVQQNPLSALNPRRSVGASVRLPIDVHELRPRADAERAGRRAAQGSRPRPALRQAFAARPLRRRAAADRHRPGARLPSRS